MATINFKKLVTQDAAQALKDIFYAMGSPIAVHDQKDQFLFGEKARSGFVKFPVTLSGKTIGYVLGEARAFAVASLLSHLAQQESEKKDLVSKSTDKDSEIFLLKELSEKLAGATDLSDIALLVVDLATAHVECTGASVMLLNTESQNLEIVAAFGKKFSPRPVLRPGVGIVGDVLLTGKIEVIQDVNADPRWVPGPSPVCSLVCVPLRAREHVLGALNVSSNVPTSFREEDVFFLLTLAGQAALALEKAAKYERLLGEREAELKKAVEKELEAPAPAPEPAPVNSRKTELPPKLLDYSRKENGEHPGPGDAVRKEMSVLLVDIRSFSDHASAMNPKENFDFLSQFGRCLEPVLEKHGGFMIQWVGDGQMALFPDWEDDSADQALKAAIDIHKNVGDFSKKREDALMMPVSVGMGVTTGLCSVGIIGFHSGLLSTVIGEPVALASRLERLTKRYGIRIALSDHSHRKLKNRDAFLIREIDLLEVPGKDMVFTVYDCFDADPPGIRDLKKQFSELFGKALHLFRHQDFEEALRIFTRLKKNLPFDRMVDVYLSRVSALSKNPPPSSWNGTTKLFE